MPSFKKVFNLFADWHRTEKRHKKIIEGIRQGFNVGNTNLKRTENLGLPHPRKLLATKREFRHLLGEKRINHIDEHLKKSLNTIYYKLLKEKGKK